MATTTVEIRAWLERGKDQGATHVIVCCDTFDWSDYPVFVKPGEDVRAIEKEQQGQSMTKVMEVYDLSMDWDSQLRQVRSFNY